VCVYAAHPARAAAARSNSRELIIYERKTYNSARVVALFVASVSSSNIPRIPARSSYTHPLHDAFLVQLFLPRAVAYAVVRCLPVSVCLAYYVENG